MSESELEKGLALHFPQVISLDLLSSQPLPIIQKVFADPRRVYADSHMEFRLIIDLISRFGVKASNLTQYINIEALSSEEIVELLQNKNIDHKLIADKLCRLSSSLVRKIGETRNAIDKQKASIQTYQKMISGYNPNGNLETLKNSIESNRKLIKKLAISLKSADTMPESSKASTIKELIDEAQRKTRELEMEVREVAFFEEIPSIFNGRNHLDGIAAFFRRKFSAEHSDAQVLTVTASTTAKHSPPVAEILNREFLGAWTSKDREGQWVTLDFHRRKLRLTHYSLRTYSGPAGGHHLKEWIVEGGDDGVKWAPIDRRNSEVLNGDMKSATFECDCPCGFRFFRLTQIGKNFEGGDRICLNAMEVFGFIDDQGIAG